MIWITLKNFPYMIRNECINCSVKSRAAKKLKDSETDALSFNCALTSFRKGDVLIKQGMLSTNVVYLRSGLIKLHIEGPYGDQIVRIVKAPGYLGLPTTFGDKVNQYSITAIDEVEACFIDITTFRNLLFSNPEFSYEIIIDICRNELEIYNRCVNRSQKQLRGKIADVILEMSGPIFNSDSFTLPISQEEIGNLIDSSRESVSRILAEFEKDKIISVSGKKIGIKNRESLLMISAKG
ncbi:MAG: Crp/Fnr family transcriptional regulator [Bacteroidales bacterium]|nr:Crp/Fnr family transcriptional regulator [Bacteroidales bacterium]